MPGWRSFLQPAVLVIFFLGFSAGLPFPLVYSTLTGWLEEAGLQRSTISTFAWLGFAYSFKFAWAPIVDALSLPMLTRWLGRRRAWLFASQIGIGLSLFGLSNIEPAQALGAFTLMAIAVAFLSATQDIVLDAYRIESAETEMQGVLAASYQYGYRVAIAVGTAGAFFIAEFGSWSVAYKAMAGCMAVGVITTLLCREPEGGVSVVQGLYGTPLEKVRRWITIAVFEPFGDFFKRYGKTAVLLFAFIALFRISDYVLGILASPFYLDIGFSKAEIASVAKFYGLWISLIGTAAGAAAILRFGLARCIVVAPVLIASTNLFFAAMTVTGPEIGMLAVTISADNFAMGFGGTVFIAYLSSLTNVSFTATQYALLSSASTFIGKLTAGYSGEVQEWIGWFGFFLYAAALGIPAILLSVVVARRHASSVAGR